MSKHNHVRWEAKFATFQAYIRANGRFPSLKAEYNGVKIGQWYYNQVSSYHHGRLSTYRINRLDAFHPAWKLRQKEKAEVNKAFLLSSDWKKHLSSEDVPLDQVLAGDQLLYCLRRGIYSCKAYLAYYEEKYGLAFWKPSGKCTQRHGDLFSFAKRKAIFQAQFPNLDFGCFNLYFALSNKTKGYVTSASEYCKSCSFSSAEDMICQFQNALHMLMPKESEVLTLKYMSGATLKEISSSIVSSRPHAEHIVTPSRVQQLEQKALHKLKHPSYYNRLKPLSSSVENRSGH